MFPWSISTKHKSLLEKIVRHLVFTSQDQRQAFSYVDLYDQGLERSSFSSMSMLVSLYKKKKPTLKSGFLTFNEGLHIMLKRAFSLDMILLLDWCKFMPLTTETNVSQTGFSASLKHWIHCLSQIHDHLLPLSRILFSLEKDLKEPLSLAQTLLIIKDQLAILKLNSREELPMHVLDWLSG